jgi:hypothetical protein
MEDFFRSGRAIDLVLALTLLEAAGLIVLHRATGRGVPPGEFLANLVSGLCLMLAVRTALVGGAWPVLLACLAAALLAHLADLRRRWHA